MTKNEQEIELSITRLEYGDADRPQRAVLVIQTDKHYSGGIASRASVYWVGKHSRQQMIGVFNDGGDFARRMQLSERTVKATQRNVDRQHAEVFTPEVVAGLVEAAKASYVGVVSKGVDGFKNTYIAA